MRTKKQYYQIRIESHINADWFTSFEDLSVRFDENGQTILTGALSDQSALYGVLMRIRDLGLTLIEVKPIHPPNYYS